VPSRPSGKGALEAKVKALGNEVGRVTSGELLRISQQRKEVELSA
jgi:hypothetical protein